MKRLSDMFKSPSLSIFSAMLLSAVANPMQTASAAPLAQTTMCASIVTISTPAPTPIEKRISILHSKLQITTAQEPLWHPVAEIMRNNASAIYAIKQIHSTKTDSMNAVDNLRSYGELVDVHADGIKKLMPAFETLYNSMSAAQKRNADLIFRDQEYRTARQG